MSTPKKSTTQKAAEEEIKAKTKAKVSKAADAEEAAPVEEKPAKVLKGAQNLQNISIENISIKPGFNPRSDLGDYSALKAQIKSQGILQPIVVVPTKPGSSNYYVLAGHRRYTIAQELGYKVVPSSVREVDIKSDEAKGIALMENNEEGRSNISDLDQAKAFQGLFKSATDDGKEEGEAYKYVASLSGYSITYVKRQMRLLVLPKEVKARLESGEISKRVAYAVAESDESVRAKVASHVVAGTTEADVRKIAADVKREARIEPKQTKDGKVSKHNRPVGNAPGVVAIAPTTKALRNQMQVVAASLLNITEFDDNGNRVGPDKGSETEWAAFSNQLAALMWTLGLIPEISTESKEYATSLDDLQERLAEENPADEPAAEDTPADAEEAEDKPKAKKKAKAAKEEAPADEDAGEAEEEEKPKAKAKKKAKAAKSEDDDADAEDD